MTSEHPSIGALRNVSTTRIVRALVRDGFQYTQRQGSQRVYRHPDLRRVVIHYHARATLPPWAIRNLLIGTRWTENDLKRLKLLK